MAHGHLLGLHQPIHVCAEMCSHTTKCVRNFFEICAQFLRNACAMCVKVGFVWVLCVCVSAMCTFLCVWCVCGLTLNRGIITGRVRDIMRGVIRESTNALCAFLVRGVCVRKNVGYR